LAAKRARLAVDDNGNSIQGALHPKSTVVINVSTANQTGTDALAGIEVVRLCATEACYVKFGAVATVNDVFLPASVPEYFTLRGDSFISCIKTAAGAGTGKLHITLFD
jgi:hypothetical protein